MTVWIVYAHTADGCRFALKAYGGPSGQEKAQAHVRRATSPTYDDPNSASPADIVGFSTLTIEPLSVEQ